MSGVVCSSCGAPLALPHDLTALDASCAYCNVQTPLPLHLVELRLHEHAELARQAQAASPPSRVEHRPVASQPEGNAAAPKSLSVVFWFVIAMTLLPLVITGLVIVSVSSAASRAAHHAPTPGSPPSPPPHAPRHR